MTHQEKLLANKSLQIRNEVLDIFHKHGLTDFHKLSFNVLARHDCPTGQVWKCWTETDPNTHKEIIICDCVAE